MDRLNAIQLCKWVGHDFIELFSPREIRMELMLEYGFFQGCGSDAKSD